MTLQQLYYLVTIAEVKSMNKATEVLFTSQSNLSKSISQLELELNMCIFERNNKGMILTPSGKKIYTYAKSMLHTKDLIQNLAVSNPSSSHKTLSIATAPTPITSHVISKLAHIYEENHTPFTFRINTMKLDNTIRNVATLEAEIGIILNFEKHIPRIKQLLYNQNLEFNSIAKSPLFVVVGQLSPLFSREEVTFKELLNYTILKWLDSDYFSYTDSIFNLNAFTSQDFKQIIYFDNISDIPNLLKNTTAFTFSTLWDINYYYSSQFNIIPVTDNPFQFVLSSINRKNTPLSDEAKLFNETLNSITQSYIATHRN